jgi:hypothetical protein
MIAQELTTQLNSMMSQDDFPMVSEQLVEAWEAQGVGSEAVEPVLRFMEANPSVTIGMPGALVHFVERFYHNGYEEALVESIARRPTAHTIWMLNRLINGTKSADIRNAYILELEKSKVNPLADASAKERINHFLDLLRV